MTLPAWIAFLTFVVALVLLDLGVFHRKTHAISLREAMIWTCIWVAMALIFNIVVYYLYAHTTDGAGGTDLQFAWGTNDKNVLLRLVRRFLPVVSTAADERF
jgi:hypothetical protein